MVKPISKLRNLKNSGSIVGDLVRLKKAVMGIRPTNTEPTNW